MRTAIFNGKGNISVGHEFVGVVTRSVTTAAA